MPSSRKSYKMLGDRIREGINRVQESKEHLGASIEEIAAFSDQFDNSVCKSISAETLRNAMAEKPVSSATVKSISTILGFDMEYLLGKVDKQAELRPIPSFRQGGISLMGKEQMAKFIHQVAMELIDYREGFGLPEEEKIERMAADILSGKISLTPSLNTEAFENSGMGASRRARDQEIHRRQIALKIGDFMGRKGFELNEVSETWLHLYESIARRVSDDGMQKLMAAMRAHEHNSPGSVSLRTLRAAQDLTREQVANFILFCGTLFDIDGEPVSIRLENNEGTERFLGMFKLCFADLVDLTDFGLVFQSARPYRIDQGVELNYLGQSFIATETFRIRTNLLTAVGRDLLRIVEIEQKQVYLDAVARSYGDKLEPKKIDGQFLA